jgi:YcaO-like protein with predicted kinase domain
VPPPGCSSPGLIDGLALGPAPIKTEAGHARALDETDRWLAPILDRVPVTRVYDATSLDAIGLPVWAAVTPLARDLTVHAGKGTTALAARISAVMEAIERVCAERIEPERIRRATFAALHDEDPAGVVEPTAFDLPFETVYHPGRSISWTLGYDLRAAREVWVPLDLVISPAAEGVCLGVETNGLAAGNNHTEAIVHALYEVIERDAMAHARFRNLYADPSVAPPLRRVAIDTLPAWPSESVRHVRSRGIEITIDDLTHDMAVPTFRATLADRSFPGREGQIWRFEGLGCDLDSERAVSRAISEAAQSHTALLVGARETFEDGERHARRTPAGLVQQLLRKPQTIAFEHECCDTDDLYDVMMLLLERFERVGLTRVVVVDLTKPDLGIPVVRMLVPGLAGPYGETARRPPLRLLRSLV